MHSIKGPPAVHEPSTSALTHDRTMDERGVHKLMLRIFRLSSYRKVDTNCIHLGTYFTDIDNISACRCALREAEVVGSNPATPTKNISKNGHLAQLSGGRFSLLCRRVNTWPTTCVMNQRQRRLLTASPMTRNHMM